MLILDGANDKLQVVTGSAGTIKVHASWVDNNAGAFTPGRTNTANITTAVTTDVVAAPGASKQRNVKEVVVFNDDASVANAIELNHTDGTNVRPLWKGTLAAKESIILDAVGRVTYYGADGKPIAPGLPSATQADQEAGSSTSVFVTPGRQQFHPSACKMWVKAGVTGNILASYNVTSLTDTGAGDVAVTIATDFSGAEYAVPMAVQRTNSTAAETNGKIGTIKTASLAAGSFSMDCWDCTATTQVIEDPTSWHAAAFGDQ